jgi:Zn-dependent peptidase ImmA (M78 family)
MNPEHEANNLLIDFGIKDLPICPFSISEKLGIQVRYMNLESIDGGIFSIKGNVGILLNENVKSPSRLRFTLAHEIGHYVMDINSRCRETA